MKRYEMSIAIAAPIGGVWSVMSDVERWHEWTASIRAIRRLDTGPLSVGSRAIVRQPRLPPGLWTVTAVEPGRSFTWVNRAPGIRIVGFHGLEPADRGVVVRLSIEMHGPLSGLMGRLTGRLTERYLALEAAGLARRSERGAKKTGLGPDQGPGTG